MSMPSKLAFHPDLTPKPSFAFLPPRVIFLEAWDQYLQKEAHILHPTHSPLLSSSFLLSFLHCLCYCSFIHQMSAEHTHSMSPGRSSTWSPSHSSRPVCHEVLLHPATVFRIHLLIFDHSVLLKGMLSTCANKIISAPPFKTENLKSEIWVSAEEGINFKLKGNHEISHLNRKVPYLFGRCALKFLYLTFEEAGYTT